MKERSGIYFAAANTMVMNSLCDHGVVSYYYAVLQRMKYVLAEKSTRQLSYSNQNPTDRDVHDFLYNAIVERMQNQKQRAQFKEDFEILRKARLRADYECQHFTTIECTEYRAIAERMFSSLNKIS